MGGMVGGKDFRFFVAALLRMTVLEGRLPAPVLRLSPHRGRDTIRP